MNVLHCWLTYPCCMQRTSYKPLGFWEVSLKKRWTFSTIFFAWLRSHSPPSEWSEFTRWIEPEYSWVQPSFVSDSILIQGNLQALDRKHNYVCAHSTIMQLHNRRILSCKCSFSHSPQCIYTCMSMSVSYCSCCMCAYYFNKGFALSC